jgi:PAS domain S-box-containing protein
MARSTVTARLLVAGMAVVVLLMTVSVLPGVRPEAGVWPPADDWLQTFGYLLAAGVVTWRVVRRREQRVLWGLVAAALLLRAYGFVHTIFVLERAPVYPSAADVAWIGSGMLLVAALIVLARQLLPWTSGTLCLDALMGGITAAAVTVTLLYGTLVRLSPDGVASDVLVTNLSYPLIDAGLLVVMASLLAATHARLAPAVLTLCLGALLWAVVDAVFLYQVTVGSFHAGSILTPTSLAGTMLVATAALLSERGPDLPRASRLGLATPVTLATVCVLVLGYDAVRPVPASAVLLASTGVLVAIGRGLLTFAGSRRAAEATIAEKDEELVRFRALVEASSDFIGIGNFEGEVLYINPAGRERIGFGPDEDLAGLTIGDTLHDEERRRSVEVERPQIMAKGYWRGESTLRHQRGGPDTPVMKSTFLVRRPGTGEPWLLSTIQRDISDLRAARAQLQRLADERQVLLQHLVEAQEAERARIAGDVHDDPVQAMAAVDLRLGLVERRLELGQDVPTTLEQLRELRSSVGEANDRLRYLLFDLDSPAQREDLPTALREAAAFVLGETLRWDVRAADEDREDREDTELPVTSRVLAYRIAKEAMVNVRKHARAHSVVITVADEDGGVCVQVEDDGQGLPPEGIVARPGHRGVADMHDRAAIAGGWVRIEPGPERGTVVRVWLPASADADR